MTVFLYRLCLPAPWVVSIVRLSVVWETMSHFLLPRLPSVWLRIFLDGLSAHVLRAHLVTEVLLRVWSMLPRTLTRPVATADRLRPSRQLGCERRRRWRLSTLPTLLTVRWMGTILPPVV